MNEKQKKIKEILDKNISEIAENLLFKGGDFIPDLWIFGNLENDKLRLSIEP